MTVIEAITKRDNYINEIQNKIDWLAKEKSEPKKKLLEREIDELEYEYHILMKKIKNIDLNI